MKAFLFLALVLLLDGVIAPTPKGTKYEGPGGGRKIPGYSDRSERHNSAPTYDRERRKALDDYAERRSNSQGPLGHVETYNRHSATQPKKGETYLYEEPNSYGGTRTNVVYGDRGNDHTQALEDRKKRIGPQVEDAEYQLVSTSGRRSLITGSLPTNKDTQSRSSRHSASPPRGMHEEKQFNIMDLVPRNHRDVGVPPTTVYTGNQRTSREVDSNLAGAVRRKVRDPEDTVSVRSRPSDDFRAPPALPERAPPAPRGAKLPKPAHEIYMGDEWLEEAPQKRRASQSPPDTARPGTKYKVQESQWSGYDYDRPPPSSRKSRHGQKERRSRYTLDALRTRDSIQDIDVAIYKRDGIEEINTQEQQTSSPFASGSNAEIEIHERYSSMLILYDEVVNNATDILMPIVADMVDGHNSTMVWDAAWEIMSLADPLIIVEGPFYQGTSSLDWWEDQIYNTTDSKTMDSIMVVNDVVWDLYSIYWHQAYDALNSTGYINLIAAAQELLVTDDTSLLDLSVDMQTHKDVTQWFLDYLSNPLSEVPCDWLNATQVTNGTRCAMNDTLVYADFEGNGTANARARLF